MKKKPKLLGSAEPGPYDVLEELVDRLDEFLAEAAFHFPHGPNCEPDWLTDRPWLHDFIERLSPEVQSLEKSLLGRLEDVPGDKELEEPAADFLHYTNQVKQYSYLVGILMGARLAGMEERRLRRLAGVISKLEREIDERRLERIYEGNRVNGGA